ncbi:transglutaminaseTgpA domain-containing protein [Phytohabitans kaempferiae]|uniref:TransglutaminaseTgpA domain-containing protein n=1 Tax=Phytohabitans kaempferiae TaxID=1620943 RepID=A0ABV6LUH9_9ACTN
MGRCRAVVSDAGRPARGGIAGRLVKAAPVPLVLMILIGLSGAALARIYAGPLLPHLVAGAAIGSVGVSAAARRLPSWLVAPVSVVAMGIYTVLALRLAAQRAELPGGLVEILSDAARNGIPRLLTAMIPVEPTPDTVLVPVVGAWLAGLAATEVAVRAGRVLLGYLPPAALYAGALYVVGPNAQAAVLPTLAFAAAAAAGLAVTGRPPSPAAGDIAAPVRAAMRIRVAAGAAAGLAAIVLLAAVVGPFVAGQVGTRPVDPRKYVQPPQVDSLDENPLIRISGWALNPDQHLLDVTSQPGGPVRLRLAVLNDYDGITWRVGATYRSAGRVLPSPPVGPSSTVDTVRQEITVADLTGRLLPTVATPTEIDGARVAFDPASGTLIRPEGLAAGLRYSVTSTRERPDLGLLTAADVPSGEAVARVLRLGDGVPEQLQRLADQLAEENGAPYQRAVAIEEFLATHYRVVADAPSGHAFPNLAFFLFGPRGGGGQEGTSEQFAAAYAVLGRLMGLPTRVVVGFQSASGTGPVRGADALAWPEVLFNGVGWVAFDPMPKPDTEPRPVEEDFKPPTEPPSEPPTEAPTDSASASASADPVAAPGDTGGRSAGAVVAGGLSTLLVLVVGGTAVVLLTMRRGLRRRRLEEGPPAQRVAGAWLEVSDALRLAGRPAGSHLDATEVAAHAQVAAEGRRANRLRQAAPPIEELAEMVNHATFAPFATDEAQARRAGAQAVAYAADLRARRSWWRRVLWSLHPGPLRWHRRR